MARRYLSSCALLLLCALMGCSGSKDPAVPVSGTVNLDGKPLPEGSLSLIGEGGAPPDVFEVKDGKFEGSAKPGKVRVEIRANRLGKPTKMGDTVIEATPENYLPSMYNTDSKIKADVTAAGLNPSTFEVKSK
jgi:hypothetical protein